VGETRRGQFILRPGFAHHRDGAHTLLPAAAAAAIAPSAAAATPAIALSTAAASPATSLSATASQSSPLQHSYPYGGRQSGQLGESCRRHSILWVGFVHRRDRAYTLFPAAVAAASSALSAAAAISAAALAAASTSIPTPIPASAAVSTTPVTPTASQSTSLQHAYSHGGRSCAQV